MCEVAFRQSMDQPRCILNTVNQATVLRAQRANKYEVNTVILGSNCFLLGSRHVGGLCANTAQDGNH